MKSRAFLIGRSKTTEWEFIRGWRASPSDESMESMLNLDGTGIRFADNDETIVSSTASYSFRFYFTNSKELQRLMIDTLFSICNLVGLRLR